MARMNLPRYVCILLHLSFLTTSRCRWSSPSRCTLLAGSRTGGIAQPLYLSSCFSRRAQAPPGGWEPLGAGVPAVCPSVLPLPPQLLLPGPLALGPPAENWERGITDISLRVHQNWFAQGGQSPGEEPAASRGAGQGLSPRGTAPRQQHPVLARCAPGARRLTGAWSEGWAGAQLEKQRCVPRCAWIGSRAGFAGSVAGCRSCRHRGCSHLGWDSRLSPGAKRGRGWV